MLSSSAPANQHQDYHFNVGGQNFQFSKENLKESHLKDSLFDIAISGRWEIPIHNLYADPNIFRKWVAPYIRFKQMPIEDALTCPQERQHLIHTANYLGLLALAKALEVQKANLDLKNERQIVRIVQKDGFLHQLDDRLLVNNAKGAELQCPIKSCKKTFATVWTPVDYSFSGFDVWAHLFLPPHCGMMEHVVTIDGNKIFGTIAFAAEKAKI